MAVIRGFRHEVKGYGARHSTDVDCLYFQFLDTGGARILQLSTLGSDQRQSQPKVSQTFQIGAEGAAELRRILDQTFPGLRSAEREADVDRAEREAPALPIAEPEDPIDRFVARAGLETIEDLSLTGSTARRRVLARDERPHAGGTWYILDFTHVQGLTFADLERDLRSASRVYQRSAVIVRDVSDDLEQYLLGSHADVIRLADLGLPPAADPVAARHVVPSLPWVEQLLGSEIYRAQKALAGRASVDGGVVGDVVSALIRVGSSAPMATVEYEAGLRPGALRPLLPVLRRLLNVDGYPTLSMRDDGTLAIDETLLRQQFGISDAALPEGDRL